MPQRAASTARRKRCSLSEKALRAACAWRLCTSSSSASSTTMISGPSVVISCESWVPGRAIAGAALFWPVATTSAPPAADRSTSRTAWPPGVFPFSSPSEASDGDTASASFSVPSCGIPSGPRA